MEQNAAKTLQETLIGLELIGEYASSGGSVIDLYRAHGFKGVHDVLIQYEDCIKFINQHLGTTYDEDLMKHLKRDEIDDNVEVIDIVIASASGCSKYMVWQDALEAIDRNITFGALIAFINGHCIKQSPANAETPGIFIDCTPDFETKVEDFWNQFDEAIEL